MGMADGRRPVRRVRDLQSAVATASSLRASARLALRAELGEQAVVADAMEPARQDVEQEPADELVGAERHDLLTVGSVAAIILVAESDAGLRRTRSGAGSRWRPGGCSATDRRAPPAARRTAAWRRRPSASSGPAPGGAGRLRRSERCAAAPKKASRPASCSCHQPGEEQAAEQLAQHAHRQEEGGARGYPARVPSGAMPPPGTIMCTCGWWVSADPHVWSTAVMPIRAPRCLGSAAMVSIVSDAALNSRS